MSHPVGDFADPPVAPAAFLKELRSLGYDFFAGVPCSLVKGLLKELYGCRELAYHPETREDSALGMVLGAWMGGRQPVVIMQNTGFGLCINALTSMTLMYRVPCLLLITWRGYQGHDAPETLQIGETVDRLLELLKIPYRSPEPGTLFDDLAWATHTQRETQLPVALLLRPGVTQ